MGAIQQALLSIAHPADSGEPAPPTFPTLGDVWAWYEATRETGYSNGDLVSPATDQSGNGRHWTQVVSGSRPQFETNQINSRAIYNADFGGFWDTGPDMSALTAIHAFVIVKAKSDAAADIGQTGLWNVGTAALSEHIPYTNGLLYSDAFSDTRRDAMSHTLNLATAYRMLEWISTATEWTLKIDGTETVHTTATNTVAAPASPTLLIAAGATSRHKLAGLYIFSAKKTGSDRTDLIDYINSLFATSYS